MAANAGVSNRLFKRHGRSKTDQAKDDYIKDKLEPLLAVSKSLHIQLPFLFLYFRARASINEMPAVILCCVIIQITKYFIIVSV